MRSPLYFILGFVVALGIGGGVAYAATGGVFVVGQPNTASATTSITNSAGTALALSSPAGIPALKVNGTAKVSNLNADRLDGENASEFALKNGRTGVIVGAADDGDGYVNTARCPSGTVATGGGGYATGIRDSLTYSGPDVRDDDSLIPNSWMVIADGDAVAWVMCYNPRGGVGGATQDLPGINGTELAAQKRKP
jgi:hypothetical protein